MLSVLVPCFCFCYVLFYFIFDARFTPLMFVSCSQCSSRFHFVSFRFRSREFFRTIFFSGGFSPPRRGGCGSLCGDRGRSLSTVPRGGLSLGSSAFLTLSSTLALSSAPPRLVPAFKRPPMRPPPFHIVPHSTRNPNLALSQENQ